MLCTSSSYSYIIYCDLQPNTDSDHNQLNYKTQPYTMTVKIKTINFIFVLDLISIDGFVCCLISIM
jgi:hypothetical protein